MPSSIRGVGLAVGLVLAGHLPAHAASPITQAFIANVMPNVDFLDRSSRFALDNSKNARVRAFALAEAREQTLAINALYDWTQLDANPSIPPSAKLDTTPTGSTKPAPASAPPAPQSPLTAVAKDERLPLGQEDLDSLEGLTGPDFDAEYKAKQADALAQLATDYADYVDHGDVPAMKALAARELPKIRKRITALTKI